VRVLEGEEEPGLCALVGAGLGDVLAVEQDLATRDLEPFGPMIACTSPEETVRSTPLTIGVPSSSATWRSLSSSVAMERL
jgi:hypothetical protein